MRIYYAEYLSWACLKGQSAHSGSLMLWVCTLQTFGVVLRPICVPKSITSQDMLQMNLEIKVDI